MVDLFLLIYEYFIKSFFSFLSPRFHALVSIFNKLQRPKGRLKAQHISKALKLIKAKAHQSWLNAGLWPKTRKAEVNKAHIFHILLIAFFVAYTIVDLVLSGISQLQALLGCLQNESKIKISAIYAY